MGVMIRKEDVLNYIQSNMKTALSPSTSLEDVEYYGTLSLGALKFAQSVGVEIETEEILDIEIEVEC